MTAELTAFSVLSGVSIFLLLASLPGHLAAKNHAVLPFACWSLVGCCVYFINSLLWQKNARNFAPVWCDISSKLLVSLETGLSSSTLCISHQLFDIMTKPSLFQGAREFRGGITYCVGLGICAPCMVMVIHFAIQGHRFDILEGIGCEPSAPANRLMTSLLIIWPPVTGIVSIVYTVLSAKAFFIRRRIIPSHQILRLPAGNSARFVRLVSFVIIQTLILIISTLSLVYANFKHRWDTSMSQSELSTVRAFLSRGSWV
ncbi:GPCR fungal pheromone mating factor [Cantharellus anzutake]|uniref:GPCR fungal pheromone mating factor n=1 Tax=Cantharellus anzutake TaxID=1750568 RepID=UPI0019032E7C|nr:GPCR fungal pheromone mating factor [Cantharellus anzutake]KAF8332022.1 GPCR fungal pheromone mating factor [Cantharellus anzutake]